MDKQKRPCIIAQAAFSHLKIWKTEKALGRRERRNQAHFLDPNLYLVQIQRNFLVYLRNDPVIAIKRVWVDIIH